MGSINTPSSESRKAFARAKGILCWRTEWPDTCDLCHSPIAPDEFQDQDWLFGLGTQVVCATCFDRVMLQEVK